MGVWNKINFLHFTNYQLLNVIGLYTFSFPMFGANQLFSVFGNVQPKWSCGDMEPTDNCTVVELCGGNLTLHYDFRSLIVDFELYCGRSHIAYLIATLQMAGLVAGSLVFGQFGDLFGRRITSIIAFAGIIGCSTASTFCNVWEAVAAFRFFTGFFIGAFVVGIFTLVMEIIEPNQRTFLRSWLNWWGQSRIVYALVAYLTRDWRNTFRIINLGTLPVFLILAIVKDPPRWLLQQNRIKDAMDATVRIAMINREEPDEEELADMKAWSVKSARKYTYKDLFVTPRLRIITLLCPLMYFSCAVVSYGMDLKTGNLSGNIFFNQILMGVCISFGKPIMFLLDRFCPGFNRRTLHQTSMGAAVVCFIIIVILMQFEGRGWRIAMTAVCVIGIVILEFQWDAVYILAVELYPTVIRSSGIAFGAIIGRLGNTLAPQIVFLSDLWAPAAYIVFIAIGIGIIVLSFFLLPDTKGQELPDTIEMEVTAGRRFSQEMKKLKDTV